MLVLLPLVENLELSPTKVQSEAVSVKGMVGTWIKCGKVGAVLLNF